MRTAGNVLLLSVAVLAVGCRGRSRSPEEVTGAGSSFVYPLMVQWGATYKKTGEMQVSYTSLGSSAGIARVTEREVDFGCTDAPMTEEQLAAARKAGGEVVHLPLVMGAVVAAYNVEGVKAPLRFTGPVLADIFLGKIKKWNDKALVNLNPDAGLLEKDITVVHRDDGSGTTFIWTDYLAKVSPQWKKEVGVGQLVKWPVGVNEVGNKGVAKHVKKTAGSIGYVDLADAIREDLAFGLVENREKEFIKANLESVTAAADGALKELPEDLRYSLTDLPGKGSYPICGTTWAVLYTQQPSARGKQVVDFLSWILGDGQEFASGLLYARLPPGLVEKAERRLALVKTGK